VPGTGPRTEEAEREKERDEIQSLPSRGLQPNGTPSDKSGRRMLEDSDIRCRNNRTRRVKNSFQEEAVKKRGELFEL
jgi:hypothetical protein